MLPPTSVPTPRMEPRRPSSAPSPPEEPPAEDVVVGVECHEGLRDVGFAVEDCAGGEEGVDEGGVFGGGLET
jgi:hypothetical protein